MTLDNRLETMLSNISATLKQVEEQDVRDFETALMQAGRIFVAGKGRSGLQMRGFAMRLMHLGLAVHVVDEVTTPALAKGDLLVVGSGSGRTGSLLRYAEKAQAVGARRASIVGDAASPIAEASDVSISIPAGNFKSGRRAEADAVLVMGSLFEHSLGLLSEVLIRDLMDELGVTEADMNGRHANLE